MYEMKVTFGSVDIHKIEIYEEKMGIQLPFDYKNFLTESNGGEPAREYFFDEKIGVTLIHFYYGLGLHDYRDLENATNSLRMIGDDFDSVIKIARDPGGMAICLGVKEKNLGQIFVFDHDSGAEEIELIKIAESFDKFFNSCFETPEQVEDAYGLDKH